MKLLLSSPRPFQWWSFTVGHAQLLLRSPRGGTPATQVDVLFKDVAFVQLPTTLDGLEVLEDDRLSVAGCTAAALSGRKVFVVRTRTGEGLVVAGAVFHHEGDLYHDDPSPLLPAFPPVLPSRSTGSK